MSGYTKFAIVGSSGIGGLIATELVKAHGAHVRVLSRGGGQTPEGVTDLRVSLIDEGLVMEKILIHSLDTLDRGLRR